MSPRALLFLVLFALAAPLAAQEFSGTLADVTPAKPKTVVANGRISGSVLCGDTRKPARGAMLLVSILPKAEPDGTATYAEGARDNAMTRVGLDGTYSAEHLQPGEYSVIAFFPGYLSPFDNMLGGDLAGSSPAAQRALMIKGGTVVIHGAEAETFNITLERGAAISGRILYSDGSPAAQVSIDLEDQAVKLLHDGKVGDNLNIGRAMRSMFTQQSSSTDDQGRYRIAGLQPGTYRVAAVQSFGSGASTGEAGIGMMFGAMSDPGALRFYSGDTTHRKQAKTYELRAGDEVSGIDITIPEHAFHRVAGRLLGSAGKLPNSGTVTLTDNADETLVYSSSTSGDPAFRNASSANDASFTFFSVPSGTYTLAVKDAQYTTPYDYSQVQKGKPATPPAPTCFAPGSITVLVKDADVPDLTLTLNELPPGTPAPVTPSTPQ